jgi:predicted RNase H-like HicB family nuclease
MTSYTALIDGEAGAYGVYFPDLPGCTAMGATLDEAIVNAAEAMRDWVDATIEQGGAVPEPRPIEALLADPEVSEDIAVGALLRSESGILAAIDAEAKRRKLTRSAFIELMARHALPEMAL